jgi:flagellar motility protein MotE (MotC chaperone)
VLFFVCFQQVALSQPGNTKVEALRVAFISKRLELSTAEAEKFWPIYNEYIDKIQAAKKNLRQAYKRRVEPLSDADAEELYKLEAQTRQAEADLFKTYNERLKTIIGVKKMVKLRIAEDEFKRELIKTIKEGGE